MPDVIVKIELSEPVVAFVEPKVEEGNVASPGAYIQNLMEGKRLDAAYEAEIDAKILEAINSELPMILVTPEYWEEKRARLKARLEEAHRNNERGTNE